LEDVPTSKITKMLEVLTDGKWHVLMEIQQQMKMGDDEVVRVVKFLKEYNFIVVDEVKKEIRLQEIAKRFLARSTNS